MPCLCHADMWRAMMSPRDGKTYRPWEPQRYQQEAHSPAAKLPENDLVFFLLDTVPQLDLSRFYAPYETETRGAPGSRAGLLPSSPLRTARESFPSSSSSLANAPCGTRSCHVQHVL
jgi:hypothetical protein